MTRTGAALVILLGVIGLMLMAAADQPETPATQPADAPASQPSSQPTSQPATQPAYRGPDGNLIRNGNFDEGKITPIGWQTVDGLMTFWTKDPDPKHGRVLKIDTDVLQSQGYKWWYQISKGALPADAPKKLPTTPPKYDTLAGLDGVFFYSDPFPVEPDKTYWLTADARSAAGGGEIFIWILGYEKKPPKTFGFDQPALLEYFNKRDGKGEDKTKRGYKGTIRKQVWRGRLTIKPTTEWKSYSRRRKPFAPTKHTPKVRWGRLYIYAYWPPGESYLDNVKLVEYDAAKIQPAQE